MFFINGFTRAAFIDLRETPRDNYLFTTFVIGLIRTSIQSFTSHVGIGSTAQKALDDLFSNCLISVSVHVDLQCLSMYYRRDSPDDPHHPVDPIPEKRLA